MNLVELNNIPASAELLNNLAVLFHLEAEEIKNHYKNYYRKNFLVKPEELSDVVYHELLDSAEAYYQKALLTLVSGAQDKEPLMVNSIQTTIRYNVARLFETRNEMDKARVNYHELLKLHPAYDDCMLRLGCMELEDGNFEKALDHFSDVLAMDSANKNAWFMVGTLNMRKKNYRAARKAFETVLSIDKHDIYSLTNLGYLHLVFARGDSNMENRQVFFLRSIEFFCKAIKYSPQNIQAAAGVAITFAETLNFKQAVDIFNQILELGPGDSTFTLLAGHTLVESGDLATATSIVNLN